MKAPFFAWLSIMAALEVINTLLVLLPVSHHLCEQTPEQAEPGSY